ncbi:Glucose-6-phosphate isomerase [Mycoplasmopsis maculosa]|uniref:Glucose-6-phosphate isomerase n=1 Tax=Mycoplasmopsis maculosa TaxID=114885 RepID=A0A449B3W7_9BACT|nr:glucose-6-phosphate isomerase [Mycoplasmopsis maculosa]VEU75276.1 Glucose-6-phosphate isomerase [Mycoplasmopsis maculosa]
MDEFVELDFSKVANIEDLKKYESKVLNINSILNSSKLLEKENLDWMNLEENILENALYTKMQGIVKNWKNQNIEVLVVIGIGPEYLIPKTTYEFLFRNNKNKKPNIEIIFAGQNISSEYLVKTLKYVENKRFAINVINKNGNTLETSIAFREFRKLLEHKIGSELAKKLIVVTTDISKNILSDLSIVKGYEKLGIVQNLSNYFAVFSPIGIFPLMVAGGNIEKFINGAKIAINEANQENLLKNNPYLYACLRHFLSKKNSVEYLSSFEKEFNYFGEWWKQLFAENYGKDDKGLLPVNATFSTDIFLLENMDNNLKNESIITLFVPKKYNNDIFIERSIKAKKYINFIDGKNFLDVNYENLIKLNPLNKFNNLNTIYFKYNKKDEELLGYLFQFFLRSYIINAYLNDINPFAQSGAEVFKVNMVKINQNNEN